MRNPACSVVRAYHPGCGKDCKPRAKGLRGETGVDTQTNGAAAPATLPFKLVLRVHRTEIESMVIEDGVYLVILVTLNFYTEK